MSPVSLLPFYDLDVSLAESAEKKNHITFGFIICTNNYVNLEKVCRSSSRGCFKEDCVIFFLKGIRRKED